MSDQRFYDGPLKVRVLGPGVFGSDLSPQRQTKLGIPTFGRPLEGFETVKDAARRLNLTVRGIYRLCKQKRLDHVTVGRDRSKRVFIKKGAKPVEAGEGRE